MTSVPKALDGGTVASPTGFSAGATYAGLKTPGPGKLDLGLLFSDAPCVVAGTFSQNSVVSPSVTLSRSMVNAGATVRGIVANSGCANCSVGEQGLTDAREVTALAATHLGVKPEEMLICSTGVIGVELPMGLIREHLPTIGLAGDGGHDLARAIITTDTHTKERAVQVEIDGRTVTVGGIAKGAGMIHPNMATMLCFMATDAAVERSFLQEALRKAVAVSFNQLDIDGDQSTNDTVLLLANGAAGNTPLAGGDAGSEAFARAVTDVAQYLARELARDGEGASRLIEVSVDGAKTDEDARRAARSVASSLLVKTAVYGRDPNWGRIMMAVGKTAIELDESKIRIFINDIQIVEDGVAIPYYTPSVVAALGEPEVSLRISLGTGSGTGLAWGCDLSEEYVVFNSAYTT